MQRVHYNLIAAAVVLVLGVGTGFWFAASRAENTLPIADLLPSHRLDELAGSVGEEPQIVVLGRHPVPGPGTGCWEIQLALVNCTQRRSTSTATIRGLRLLAQSTLFTCKKCTPTLAGLTRRSASAVSAWLSERSHPVAARDSPFWLTMVVHQLVSGSIINSRTHAARRGD